DLGSQLAKILDDVVGKRVVVIEHQELMHDGPLLGKGDEGKRREQAQRAQWRGAVCNDDERGDKTSGNLLSAWSRRAGESTAVPCHRDGGRARFEQPQRRA